MSDRDAAHPAAERTGGGALLGDFLVVVADTLGRTVIAPEQIPVGIITAAIGAPYSGRLVRRSKT